MNLPTISDIRKASEEHIKNKARIWAQMEEDLYQEYLKQGYYSWWARAKAQQETDYLRQHGNADPTIIPEEQTTQGDLD